MAENLNYEAEGSRCYDETQANCEKYGRLYDWETAAKVCPSGWHLPSNAEWDVFIRFVDDDTGGSSEPRRPDCYNSKTAGKYLKAKNGWNNFEKKFGGGIDKYGFAALPGGHSGEVFDGSSSFSEAGDFGYWWTASEYDEEFAYHRYMGNDGDYLEPCLIIHACLLSVRCVRD